MIRWIKYVWQLIFHNCPDCQSGHMTYVGPHDDRQYDYSAYVCYHCESLKSKNKMFPIELKIWPGLRARVTKVSTNSGYLQEGEVIEGKVFSIPTVGFRFQCGYEIGRRGGISTNIVTKIRSFNEKKGGEFETYSGSVYRWDIVEEYEDGRMGILTIEESDCGGEQLRVIQEKFDNPRIKE